MENECVSSCGVSVTPELRALLESDDFATCMQGVHLARSLGDEVVAQLLAGLRIEARPTRELFDSPRPHARLPRYPTTLPQLVGTKLRDAVVLALADGSNAIPEQPELAITGWIDVHHRMPVDLSGLRGSSLRSLLVFEARELRGVRVLESLPLESLRLSNVDAYDLSNVRLSQLRHLVLEAFELRPAPGTRFAPSELTGLRTLRLYSNPFMLDLEACARMPDLRLLDARTASTVDDLGALSRLTRLRELVLTNSRVTDVSSLPDSIDTLGLASARNLVDIAPLTRLEKLRVLDLSRTAVRDWRPLMDLPRLERLNVRMTPIATTLPPELEEKVHAWSR